MIEEALLEFRWVLPDPGALYPTETPAPVLQYKVRERDLQGHTVPGYLSWHTVPIEIVSHDEWKAALTGK